MLGTNTVLSPLGGLAVRSADLSAALYRATESIGAG